MSKKMANKILAAVLSLGAVMNSGSTSSAAEKTDKKSEIQNSQRNIVSNYVKPGLNVLKENLSPKDLVYFFISYRIYDKLKRMKSLPVMDVGSLIEHIENINRLKELNDDYYISISALHQLSASRYNVGTIRTYLLRTLVERTSDLLINKGIVRSTDASKELFQKEEDNKKKKTIEISQPSQTASQTASQTTSQTTSQQPSQTNIEIDNKKEEIKLLSPKPKTNQEELDSKYPADLLKLLDQRSQELSKFIFNSDRANYVDFVLVVDTLLPLFKNFNHGEILNRVILEHDKGGNEELFHKFIESLYNLVHVGKYLDASENKETKKNLVRDRQSDWDYCVDHANKFLKFCGKNLKKLEPPKPEVEKIEQSSETLLNQNSGNNDNQNSDNNDNQNSGNNENQNSGNNENQNENENENENSYEQIINDDV